MSIKASKGISLEIREGLIKRKIKYNSLFPNQTSYRQILDKIFDSVLNYKTNARPIHLTGDSGCGKSSLLRECLNKIYETKDQNNIIFSKISYLTDDLQDVKGEFLINQPFMNSLKSSSLIENWENLCFEFNLIKNGELASSFLDRPFNSFSRGQKQRFLIIAEILKSKSIFFLDEATSGLDKVNENRIIDYLIDKFELVVLISHSYKSTEKFDVMSL